MKSTKPSPSDQSRTYDPTQDYAAGTNPNGVWSYGFGDCGGDFTLFTTYERIGPGEAWWDQSAYGGFYRQTDEQTIEMRPAPNKAVKVRFTAAASGWYTAQAKWTSLRFPQRTATDKVQEEVDVAAYTNSSPATEHWHDIRTRGSRATPMKQYYSRRA
jgi:hypothetical protein